MKTIPTFLALFLLSAAVLFAKAYQPLTLAGEVVSTFEPVVEERSPSAMAAAANRFLASLYEEERKQAQLSLVDPERTKWTNVPTRADDGGLRLGDLKQEQLEKAYTFLTTVLSERGYETVKTVMLADDLLLLAGSRPPRQQCFLSHLWSQSHHRVCRSQSRWESFGPLAFNLSRSHQ